MGQSLVLLCLARRVKTNEQNKCLTVFRTSFNVGSDSEAYAVPKLFSQAFCSCLAFLAGSHATPRVIQERSMASGKVKWWNNKSGFGFISQDSGQDVFVHHSSVIGHGFKVLNPGDEVTFEIVATEKGPKAEKVQLARFR